MAKVSSFLLWILSLSLRPICQRSHSKLNMLLINGCLSENICCCWITATIPHVTTTLQQKPRVVKHTSDGSSHLCSRFLRLSRSEWSTPGSCHTLHIGSSSYATAGRRKTVLILLPTVCLCAFVLNPPSTQKKLFGVISS